MENTARETEKRTEADQQATGTLQTESQSTEASFFSFTNDYLNEAVQSALNKGMQYFQVKLSVPSPGRNGVSDGFNFLLSNVSLGVSYD